MLLSRMVRENDVKRCLYCEIGGREQFIDGVRAMTATCSNMLDDAKGASRRIEDNGMRQKLLDAARYAGEATRKKWLKKF